MATEFLKRAAKTAATGEEETRLSRLEGMEGHARAGDVRLEKYFPDENSVLTP